MPSKAAEQAELDYMRARMGSTSISTSDPPRSSPNAAAAAASSSSTSTSTSPPPSAPSSHATSTPVTPSSSAPPLDDSLDADAALSLKEQGNALYKSGAYDEAVAKYTSAASSAHLPAATRGICLANRAAAHLKMRRFKETVADTSAALGLKPGYVKALARRKEAREALGDFRAASEDAKEMGMGGIEVRRLESMAEEREVKDREEALESLKGLGNSILGNFGMSLDDLNMKKDPNTGSYSINFKN